MGTQSGHLLFDALPAPPELWPRELWQAPAEPLPQGTAPASAPAPPLPAVMLEATAASPTAVTSSPGEASAPAAAPAADTKVRSDEGIGR
ncbi:MAG TPA: hypothetical protein PKK06_13700, partial [Phycisphaerae bacterium]|nr:hypothetical protein [Phycisphaerae bacterium]HNU46299.1 hypothetical protein [Phycisphaerae bacterium]